MNILSFILRKILNRKLFKGQFKLFHWFLKRNLLPLVSAVDKPVIGNFQIHLNTKNYIDACIYYTGDYEPYLKIHFAKLIKRGDVILDIGANIGFHSLYFAELTGSSGRVYSFEPIKINYEAFEANLLLNVFPQITPVNLALGDENKVMYIHIDSESKNPGTFNLFSSEQGNVEIQLKKGDDFLSAKNIETIDFIKIDVEGFEPEVIKGLTTTIRKSNPIIVFEYDNEYQTRNNDSSLNPLHLLAKYDYTFFTVDGYGKCNRLTSFDNLTSAEIIALPAKKQAHFTLNKYPN
jgi:FkbM family methyltransferase